jgi:hypothetical protein
MGRQSRIHGPTGPKGRVGHQTGFWQNPGVTQPERQPIEDVLEDPSLLKGLTPDEVRASFWWTNDWRVEMLRSGSAEGRGWALREYRDGIDTGRLVRWHPGGGHKGPLPYWRVSSPRGGKSEPIW